MDYIARLTKEDRDKFYQSKYDYFRKMAEWTIIVSVLASTTYWVSDCQLFGRLARETFFPRFFMLIPLCLYIFTIRRVNNYKIVIPFSYLMLHGIMWCTIWSIYYLPIKQHANEGFIIMQLMFLAYGFCVPRRWSVFFHAMLMVDILVSYPINHYESISLMMTLGIPCLAGSEVVVHILETSYAEQYRLQLKLESAMMHDQLTHVYNRNKIADLCVKGTDIFHMEKAGIMLMDLDFFKKINDKFGHDIGDQVLVQLTKIINSCICDSDIVIRWGGEEFVVILPNSDETQTQETAEKIRRRVEEFENGICHFTVSIGTAVYHGANYHEIIKKADTAMYEAKRNGRNQVVAFSPAIPQ
ncbi:MAG: GGDEF domain-containing protein [Treponemataceae bacterium]|nr:GGDEF domain-containing protein [Treponemataceae bacterium]